MNTETSQKGSLCLCPCLHFAFKYHKKNNRYHTFESRKGLPNCLSYNNSVNLMFFKRGGISPVTKLHSCCQPRVSISLLDCILFAMNKTLFLLQN